MNHVIGNTDYAFDEMGVFGTLRKL